MTSVKGLYQPRPYIRCRAKKERVIKYLFFRVVEYEDARWQMLDTDKITQMVERLETSDDKNLLGVRFLGEV